MLSCLNLGKCLAMVGGLKNIKKITEISHKKAVSTIDLQKAKQKFSNLANIGNKEFEKESEVNITGSSTNNNIKNSNLNQTNDIVFENNGIKQKENNDNMENNNNIENNNNNYDNNDNNNKDDNNDNNNNKNDINKNDKNNNDNDNKSNSDIDNNKFSMENSSSVSS